MIADASAKPDGDWRCLVSEQQLTAWLDSQSIGHGPIENACLLAGGTQNILLRFRRAGRDLVLRRPPLALRANSNQTIMREARILSALRGTDIPAPALVASCDDTGPLGSCFYVMDAIDGFNPRYQLPAPHSASAPLRSRMGYALVEGIAKLARLDHDALGLEDFGRADHFLARQSDRWRRQLSSYAELPGWPGAGGLGDVDRIGAWLDRHRPATFHAGIVHGDYHLSNVMYRHDSAELAAIVDWELATIGAPLIDLGWLIATWPRPDGQQQPGIIGTSPWNGFPTARELVDHYHRVSGLPIDDMDWFAVLACYKLAILLEGTHARACAGQADMATGERLHAGAVALLHRAEDWISSASPQAL